MNYFLRLLLLFVVSSYAQDQGYYVPENTDALKDYFKTIHKAHLSKIEGKHSGEIKKIYAKSVEKKMKSIKDSNYYFNSDISERLDKILGHIYSTNPSIDTSNFKFFIKNSIIANAACYGDGMFEINMGLFNTLESDDELASVICHEIAHYVLQHGLKNVTNWVTVMNSKETKQKVRQIKRNRYGRSRAALTLIDKMFVNMLDYSKEVEAEADSLGYILLSKTKYNKTRALSSLKKLENVDDMVLHHPMKVDSIFNFEEYPFKSFWLKESVSLFDTDEKINDFAMKSDTMKTHPEIVFRVNKLKKDFNVEESEKTTSVQDINAIKAVSQEQVINNSIDLKLLDLALYETIEKYQNQNISKEFYTTTITSIFRNVYLAKKNHELAKYVPQKNGLSDEKEINKLRLFLHNLELNEIKKIGNAFCNYYKNDVTNKTFKNNHDFFNQ